MSDVIGPFLGAERCHQRASDAASFLLLATASRRQAPSSCNLGAVQRWPRTIRIRQDASVTTAEPAIAVAGDQVIDCVAGRPGDNVKKPCPPPPRKLARDAQHGFGFYRTLAVRHKRKGIRAIRIDTELLSERTSLGQLHRIQAGALAYRRKFVS